MTAGMKVLALLYCETAGAVTALENREHRVRDATADDLLAAAAMVQAAMAVATTTLAGLAHFWEHMQTAHARDGDQR